MILNNIISHNISTKTPQFQTELQRLVAAEAGLSTYVTPETCIRAPTVQSIITAISRRIASTPVHVLKTSERNGKEIKEKQPNHPIQKLLNQPNDWQSAVEYWQDLASSLVRHGKFFAKKGQGTTGPIRKLFPIKASDITVKQDQETLTVSFQYGSSIIESRKMHYIRGPARDYYTGDSPVDNIKTAIGLEIACEVFGETFFNNGAIPLLFLKYMQGTKGFKTPEDEQKFVDNFQEKFSGSNRHKAFLLPPGIEPQGVPINNEQAQFLETRKFNQTVIAGAWNVPPHLIGNLENGTYNNVEQQDKDFTINVIMPYIRMIESAMERDLLNDNDRKQGIIIRFNMDAVLRADYKTRMEGHGIQIQHAMETPNEARETEGKNPSTDPAANKLYHSANLIPAGEKPELEPSPEDEEADDADTTAESE